MKNIGTADDNLRPNNSKNQETGKYTQCPRRRIRKKDKDLSPRAIQTTCKGFK